MRLAIENVLTAEELASARIILAKARFVDERGNEGELAAKVKHNLQLSSGEEENMLTKLTYDAIHRNALFIAATLPKAVCPPLFNRYVPGMRFGTHVDNAINIGAVMLRTDVAMTLFLSNPEDYEGGELLIEDTYGIQRVKLPAGSLVVYPSSSLHRVEPITSGYRDVAVFWVQSLVRDITRRNLLFQLDTSIQGLRARTPESPEIISLVSCYHNLLRMWADV